MNVTTFRIVFKNDSAIYIKTIDELKINGLREIKLGQTEIGFEEDMTIICIVRCEEIKG